MKFALVITNLQGGGAEKALLNIAQLLVERQHTVYLVTLESKCTYTLPDGLIYNCLTPLQSSMPRGWLGKRLLARKLRQYVQPLQPDIVVSTLPFADEVTHLAHLPNHYCRIANTLSVEITKLAQTTPSKAKRRLKRYQALYQQHRLIAVSQGVADDLKQKLQLTTPIQVIPNPFDFEQIRSQATQDWSEFGKPYVLHVGRFSPQKRHDLLLKAWQHVPTTHDLVLLTEPHPNLLALIQERDLESRVHVMGFQANPYMWMRHAALVVLCSDHEGLPNVLIEALICGTPVVSTACPSGPREILGAAGQVCLVPVDDAEALIKVITEQLNNPLNPDAIDLERYKAEVVIQAYERLVPEAQACVA